MKTNILTVGLASVIMAGNVSAASLNFDGTETKAVFYNFSGLEVESKNNDDGTSSLFTKQIFIDGALAFPETTNWRFGIFAASHQSNPSSGSTTTGKDLEIKPTYETSVNDSWNVGNEFGFAAGNGNGDAFWTKPFTYVQVSENFGVFAETLWKIWDGGDGGINENLIHPMYQLTPNLKVGMEMFYKSGQKNTTDEEVALRPNFSYNLGNDRSVWGKIELGDQSDKDNSAVDGEYIKYAVGYNTRLNSTFRLITEVSMYSWEKDYNNTGGDNYFAKIGLAY